MLFKDEKKWELYCYVGANKSDFVRECIEKSAYLQFYSILFRSLHETTCVWMGIEMRKADQGEQKNQKK